MCEFCVKHGEGKKWYLEAKNYSDDLLSDLHRRRFIRELFSHPNQLYAALRRLKVFSSVPKPIQRIVGSIVTSHMKKWHFGQVVPLEDVESILSLTNSVVRLPCLCRHVTLGKEVRYCYGISVGPSSALTSLFEGLNGRFIFGPDTSSFEELSQKEALNLFRQHEQEGLCHSIWTLKGPFIGSICNCNQTDCIAMRATVTHDLKIMFRAEYVAAVDPDLCTGCRSCLQSCQFKALSFSKEAQKAVIDQTACYGCGVCRSMCPNNAINLVDRSEVRAVASLW